MPPKPKDPSGAMGKPLNIRVTDQDLSLLDQLVTAERTDLAARKGVDPEYVDVSRASVIRVWIRDAARARGLLPPLPPPPVQGVLPLVAAPPAPAPVPVPVEPAPVAAPAAEERHEEPVEPAAEPAPKRHRGLPDLSAVRTALTAATGAKGAAKDIAEAIGVQPSTLSHFKNGRGLSEDKVRALVGVLRKRGQQL